MNELALSCRRCRQKNLSLELDHWKALIRVLSVAKMWQEIEQVWEDMAKATDPVLPDPDCYTLAIDAAAGKGVEPSPPVLHGEHVLEQMRLRGIPPPLTSYMKVLMTHLEAGRTEEAEAIYQKASANEMLSGIWIEKQSTLDLLDFDVATGKVLLDFALKDRAVKSLARTSAKRGFRVLTRLHEFNSRAQNAEREKEFVQLMKNLGMKAKKDPRGEGRIEVKESQLQLLGLKLTGAPEEEFEKLNRALKKKRLR